MRILLSVIAICIASLSLNACNTIGGVGDDIRAGGNAISNSAKTVQSKI